MEKPVGVAEKRLTEALGTIRLIGLVAVLRATSTGRHHLWLALRVNKASPRIDICRVAELRGSPHQLTSSQNSQ